MAFATNQRLGPSFTIELQMGANPVIPCTVYDRAGNPLDLTGFILKFAAKKVFRASNGLGQMTNQERVFFDITAAIVGAAAGNITLTIPPSFMGNAGSFAASLRLFNGSPTTRNPDDVYAGTFFVNDGVVRSEA